MAYSAEAYRYANDILERRREESTLRYLKKQEEIRANIPEFTSMEREKRSLNLLRLRAKLSHDESEYNNLQKGIDELNTRIENSLQKHGYKLTDLEESYSCNICNDTGFMPDGHSCRCRELLLSQYDFEKIKANSPLSASTFETFDLTKYSDKYDPIYEVSPRDNMRSVLEECIEFVNTFPNKKSLLMIGSAGLGKTHLALSIADKLLKKNFDVIYCSCSNIFNIIEEERSDFSRHSDTLERLKTCSLLVLDDLGSEYVNNPVRSLLYDIINSRLSSSLSTIVTTNYIEEKHLQSVYGEKISSRLCNEFSVLAFMGEDIRKLNST